MGRNNKYSYETKIAVVQRCLGGKSNPNHEASLLGVYPKTIRRWIAQYESLGDAGLITSSKNSSYSATLRQSAVQDYLDGKGSYLTICKEYGIRSASQLRNWVMKYTGHEELKTSRRGGEAIMTKGRKTTYEERIEIVEYCIAHQNNYNLASEKFKVSYQQVYSWLKKYEADGVNGLLDKRGRTKPLEEMNEMERLRAENRLLKAKNKKQEMEMNYLKKLDEIERRRR
jgi:transposase-like protein